MCVCVRVWFKTNYSKRNNVAHFDSYKLDLTDCIHKYTRCQQRHKGLCLPQPDVCVFVHVLISCVCVLRQKQTNLVIIAAG